MISNLSNPKPKRPIIAIVIAAVVVVLALLGVFWFLGQGNKKTTSEYPLYLSFAGNYVFSVPKEYSVDEQSVPGIQLIYSGTFTVTTLADIYDVGGVSAQALTELKDGNFKKFVNDTFVPNLKKDIESEDVQVKFSNDRGQDAARITAKKDGNAFRFVYLRNGKHPVAMVAKEESDVLKAIAQSVVDVEESALKDEAEAVKTAIKSTVEDMQANRLDELYNESTPELQSRSTKDEVVKAVNEAADYVNGNIVIAGGSMNDAQNFSSALRFTKADDKDQKEPAFGSLALKKLDGKWKLEMLGLPSKQEQ